MYGLVGFRTIFGWDTTIWKSGIWGCKKIEILKKISFKVVQMKFLAMHITNKKLSFDIYGRKFTKYLHGTRSLLKGIVHPNMKILSLILTLMSFQTHKTFVHGNITDVLLSMEGQRALGFHQKYLNLCSEDERRSYGFEMTHEGEY